MARTGTMTYDPKTGKWTSNSSGSSSNNSNSSTSGSKTDTKSSGDNLSATTSDSKSATGSSEKKYNWIEYNILEGSLSFIATPDTIKLNAGDTVTLKGLGKFLSGKYFVQDVTRSVSPSGYSHSATLIKTDFGKSIKSSVNTTTSKNNSSNSKVTSSSTSKAKTAKKSTTQPKKVTKTSSKRVHYLKKGESLWSVAKKYYGNGSLYTKIAKANNISKSQYTKLKIGRKLIIP